MGFAKWRFRFLNKKFCYLKKSEFAVRGEPFCAQQKLLDFPVVNILIILTLASGDAIFSIR